MADGLVAFVSARMDEDEATANAAWDEKARLTYKPAPRIQARDWDADDIAMVGPRGPAHAISAHVARHDPARALREVEAGRQILTAYIKVEADGLRGDGWIAFRFAVETLAGIWRDHPEYLLEWAL